MNFKDVAHKTVAELFDMLKAKEAAIKEMDEVIKMQDADLRKYEKQLEGHQFTIQATARKLTEAEEQIESLKEQLNNMEACYIEKKKQVEDALSKSTNFKTQASEMFTGETKFCGGFILSCMEAIETSLRGAND